MTGSYSKAEVLPGPERRRSWSTAEKLSIVQEMLGALYCRSVAVSGASSLDGNGSGTERREPVRIDVRRAAGG